MSNAAFQAAVPPASGRPNFRRRDAGVTAGMMPAVLLLLLTACTLRPYQPPQVEPASLTQADPAYFVAQSYDPQWWRQFEDPVLENLEAVALE